MIGFGTSPLELMAAEAMLQGLVYCDEFVYSCSWVKNTPTGLTALGQFQNEIQIDGDSDFIVQEQNLVSILDDDTADPSPNFLLTVTRAGSGRNVMNQPQHVQNITGNYWSDSTPGRKPMPGLLQTMQTLSCRLQNLTSVAPARVDLAFVGFKVFYVNGGSRRDIFHAL